MLAVFLISPPEEWESWAYWTYLRAKIDKETLIIYLRRMRPPGERRSSMRKGHLALQERPPKGKVPLDHVRGKPWVPMKGQKQRGGS